VKIFCNEQQVFEDSEAGMDIVKSPIKNKKRKVVTGGEYCDLSDIHPSSNITERVCCNIHFPSHENDQVEVTDARNIMFLKLNHSYSDVNLVSKVVAKKYNK
jgi:hypothetical protein